MEEDGTVLGKTSANALVIRSAARIRTDSVIPLNTSQLMRVHLERIRLALPYDAAQVLVFDRTNDRHWQIAQIGYPPEIAQVMTEDFTKDWPKPVWCPIQPGDDLPPTISAEQDLPTSFRRSPVYVEHIGPAGYLDGLTLELSHRGRYVGLANFSSRTEGFYVDEVRQRSLAFATLLGHAVSATAHELEEVPPSSRAAVLDASGTVSALEGRQLSRLAGLPAFHAVIRPLFAAPQSEVAFLWVVGRTWSRVLVRRHLDDGADSQHHLVVIEREIDRPFGLTFTELRVLTRLITCSTNDEVATALGIGVRTVHTHVSNILAKLGCDRRGQAVASAIRNALFLPEPTPDASLSHLLL